MTTEAMLLEDVLFSLRQNDERPTPEAVQDWIARFPQFAKEIQEAAAVWAEMELHAALHQPSAADERLVAEARSAILNALRRSSQQRPGLVDVSTLTEAVRQRGVSTSDLGRQMALPTPVVSGVIRGRIMGATIPETFTRLLAYALGVEPSWIKERYSSGVAMAYLAVTDACSPYNAARPVRAAADEVACLTFQQAVMESESMDEAQRSFWLEAT
jgi:hypothetical protein